MKKKRNDVEWFIALPDEEKERIFQEIERETPEQRMAKSRPLNAEERSRFGRFKRGLTGRPKKGEGAQAINITVERGLLRRADAYAEALGVSRAQLVAQGLELVMSRHQQRAESHA